MEHQKPAANGHTGASPGAEILDAIASFFRQYLVCDDHQLTILTLWSACAHCRQRFRAAPYLDIRSPEPHSGKSRCVDLLNCLCEPNECFTGVPAPTLIQRLLAHRSIDVIDPETAAPFVLLLDDCHHSFGPSERQPLLALLNSGSDVAGYFPCGQEDYYLFGPKAFAGNAPLPRSLAARCIPIVLRRPKPSEKFNRYQQETWDAAEKLRPILKDWLKQISSPLAQAAQKDPANLPPTLSLGQRKCSEPLLHLADLAGGSWSARVRAALSAVFDLSEASHPLQMLFDVRSIFILKDNPEYLATCDLLSELRAMESRPWSAWGSKSGRRLAFHLRPFGIGPEYQHRESDAAGFRGYLLKDFQDAWERYLPPLARPVELNHLPALPVGIDGQFGSKTPSETSSETANSAIGAD